MEKKMYQDLDNINKLRHRLSLKDKYISNEYRELLFNTVLQDELSVKKLKMAMIKLRDETAAIINNCDKGLSNVVWARLCKYHQLKSDSAGFIFDSLGTAGFDIKRGYKIQCEQSMVDRKGKNTILYSYIREK